MGDSPTQQDVESFKLVDLAIKPGSALFGCRLDEYPVAVCLACWDAARSREVWGTAESSFFRFEEYFRREWALRLDAGYQSLEPPPVPWIASVVVPFFKAAPEDERETLLNAAEALTRCTVWALMDLEREAAGGRAG